MSASFSAYCSQPSDPGGGPGKGDCCISQDHLSSPPSFFHVLEGASAKLDGKRICLGEPLLDWSSGQSCRPQAKSWVTSAARGVAQHKR
jgi:hypothetical protein